MLLGHPLESKLRYKVSDCKSFGNPHVFFQKMNDLLCPPILVIITVIPSLEVRN